CAIAHLIDSEHAARFDNHPLATLMELPRKRWPGRRIAKLNAVVRPTLELSRLAGMAMPRQISGCRGQDPCVSSSNSAIDGRSSGGNAELGFGDKPRHLLDAVTRTLRDH